MTREVLNKLTPEIRGRVERYRNEYGQRWWERDSVRREMSGYAQGLKDGGLLTESERKVLFVYMTIVNAQNRK